MTPVLAPLFTWMLTELVLTAALSGVYLGLRRTGATPADRYLFLKLAFAAAVFLPWIPALDAEVWLRHVAPSAPRLATAALTVKVEPPVPAALAATLPALFGAAAGAYALCVALLLGRIFASSVKLKTLAEAARPVGTADGVPILATDAPVPPATFGWLRPVILIPQRTLDAVTTAEREMILAHESQHIVRRDYLYNLLRALVQAVLAFSPWIHWLGRRFIEDMELSCDALTIERSGCTARSYGTLLFQLGTATRSRTDLVCSGLFVSQSFLSRRISAMKTLKKRRNRFLPVVAFVGVALAIGPAAASLGVAGAVDGLVASAGAAPAKAGQVFYRVIVKRQNETGDAASGTLQLEDGVQSEILVGSVLLTLKPRKVGPNTEVVLQAHDGAQARIVWSSTGMILSDDGSANVESKIDAPGAGDVSGISVSLWTAVASRPKAAVGLVDAGDGRIFLHFRQPTEVRDLIKTVAQLTGKNVILDRDVHGKITLDDAHPITKAQAYQAFLQALRLLDLDVIERANVIKIVHKDDAGEKAG